MAASDSNSRPGEVPAHSGTLAKWHVLRTQERLATPICTVWQKRFRNEGDGREGEFFTFEYPDWVQAVALTPEGELILVEQFRFGTESFGWELSGGVMDAADEGNPIVTARRELLEETGYAASGPATLIGQAHPNPALQGNRVHYVLLEGCTRIAEPSPDANEELCHRVVDWAGVQALLEGGAISHALSVCGLYAYERYLRATRATS